MKQYKIYLTITYNIMELIRLGAINKQTNQYI